MKMQVMGSDDLLLRLLKGGAERRRRFKKKLWPGSCRDDIFKTFNINKAG